MTTTMVMTTTTTVTTTNRVTTTTKVTTKRRKKVSLIEAKIVDKTFADEAKQGGDCGYADAEEK